MASTDLGQRMRDALEATLPDEEVALRRVARQRSVRLHRVTRVVTRRTRPAGGAPQWAASWRPYS
jgi:hypothetical protein